MIHFIIMVSFAALVSIVFGIVGRGTNPERFKYGAKIFAEFVGVGLALAWLLYLLP